MKKERDSSIELYRILATLSVLVAHWNGWFVGGFQDGTEIINNPTFFRCGQLLIGACCACCVNCFLLITGYFGLKLRVSSVINYIVLLQGLFIPFYLFYCLVGGCSFSLYSLIGSAFVITKGGYFVQDYFILMLLSPILNAFIDKYGNKSLYICLLLILVELYFDCIMNVEEMGILQGYSVFHFCLMYLIGRLIFLFRNDIVAKQRLYYIAGYFVCVVLIISQYLVGFGSAFNYSNPIVILTGVFSFIPFIYNKKKNAAINWFAKGSFAVYIIQILEPAHSFLIKYDNSLLTNNAYIVYLAKSAIFIILFYVVCIIYDKIRNYCSAPISKYISKIVETGIGKMMLKLNLNNTMG